MKRRAARIPLRIWVGQVIRRHRRSMELTQAEFAESIDMDRTYYAMIEIGKKTMRLDTLESVCGGLNVRPSAIMAMAEADAEAAGDGPKPTKPRKKKTTRQAK